MAISKDIFLKGDIMKKLNGNKLAGGNPAHGRIDNDFYATDPKAVKMLLDTHILDMPYCDISFLEPCVGQGHIVEEVKKYFEENKDINITVALLEYLIKTYTEENQWVLDFTMGSGSTGVACVNTNRNFIGIELDKKYFEIAKERIENIKND